MANHTHAPPDTGPTLLPPYPAAVDASVRTFMADGPLGATMATSPVFQGPKRKRLIKACDACHKSKRRCDGKAPCGNCYFAAKECKYTDSSGRPVPAPNAPRPERAAAFAEPTTTGAKDVGAPSAPDLMPSLYAVAQPVVDVAKDAQAHPRKRHRGEDDDAPAPAPALQEQLDIQPADGYPGLDHAMIHELVNLFFAHCHPHRLIIHKTSFFGDLTLDRVPRCLLNAICALAAPLSLSPRLRTSPPRLAGLPYAAVAHSLLIDPTGRLRPVQPTLAAAQALVLLQMHELTLHNQVEPNTTYSALALRVLQDLGLHTPDIPILTPVPSVELRRSTIVRECVRRTFWMNQLICQLATTLSGKPRGTIVPALERTVRLPCDETNFEMSTAGGLPAVTNPEYLLMPPVKTSYASEFGHLLRITKILYKTELIRANRPDGDPEYATLAACEEKLHAWNRDLSDHLLFSETALQEQLNMWDTSYNTGAWCFFFMHTIYACCYMVIENNKAPGSICSREYCTNQKWAEERVQTIIEKMGVRARNTVLLGLVLWFYNCSPYMNRRRLCDGSGHPEDPTMCFSGIENNISRWISEYEATWGPWELPNPAGTVSKVLNGVSGDPTRPPASSPHENRPGSPMELDQRHPTTSRPPRGADSSLMPSIASLQITNGEPSIPPLHKSKQSKQETHSGSSRTLDHLLLSPNVPPGRRSDALTNNDPEPFRAASARQRDNRGRALPSLKDVGLLDSYPPGLSRHGVQVPLPPPGGSKSNHAGPSSSPGSNHAFYAKEQMRGIVPHPLEVSGTAPSPSSTSPTTPSSTVRPPQQIYYTPVHRYDRRDPAQVPPLRNYPDTNPHSLPLLHPLHPQHHHRSKSPVYVDAGSGPQQAKIAWLGRETGR